MDVEQLHQAVFDPIKLRLGHFRQELILVHYRDVLSMVTLCERLDKEYGEPFMLGPETTERVTRTLPLIGQFSACLKSAIMFSTICISEFLSEVLGKRSVSLTTKIKNPNPILSSLDPAKILGGYKLTTYRHKIVVHHDQSRFVFGMYRRLIDYRVCPVGHDWTITSEASSKLDELAQKYQSIAPELAHEHNYREIIEILFSHIPIGRIGAIDRDRDEIDNIAEQIGCKSPTIKDVLRYLDEFLLEVTRVVTFKP